MDTRLFMVVTKARKLPSVQHKALGETDKKDS